MLCRIECMKGLLLIFICCLPTSDSLPSALEPSPIKILIRCSSRREGGEGEGWGYQCLMRPFTTHTQGRISVHTSSLLSPPPSPHPSLHTLHAHTHTHTHRDVTWLASWIFRHSVRLPQGRRSRQNQALLPAAAA